MKESRPSFINPLELDLYTWQYGQAYEALFLPYREMQKYNLPSLAWKEPYAKYYRGA